MARPSRNTDQLLIQAGKQRLIKSGMQGLSLRQVAEDAGVNLGMFHYHFKTKDKFVAAVLQTTYENFFAGLQQEFQRLSGAKNAHQRLRAMLQTIGGFVFSERELISLLLQELIAGNTLVTQVVSANIPRHLALVHSTIIECQKQGTVRKDLPPEQIIILCASSIASSTLIATGILKKRPKLLPPPLQKQLFSAEILEQRLDFILRGIAP